MFKKYDKRQLRKIFNIVDTIGKDGLNDKENINYMIAQALPILKTNMTDEKIEKMTDKEKERLKNKVIEEINECLKQYSKYQKRRKNIEKIIISWNGREYTSKYINIEIYFYINESLKEMDAGEVIEDVLVVMFDGICDSEILNEIKRDDPIYYELILEDVSNLIYRTMDKILKIKKINKRNKTQTIIEYNNTDSKTDVYTLFLENYNLTPEQINENKAVDILKILAEISKKQILREAEEQAKGISDKIMREAFVAQTLKEIGEGDNDG